jgi:ParB family chromosome partitioning protein
MSKAAKRLGRGLDSLVSNLRGIQEQEPLKSPPIQEVTVSRETIGTVIEKHPSPVFHVEQASSQIAKDGGLITVPIDIIQPNPYQPRTVMDDKALASLVASIRKSGILQPITVRKRDGRHEIIAGERRWTAAKACGLTTIPVIVRDADDEQMLELALIENIQREDLNAIDRSKAYKRFCTRFNLRAEELADRLGEDRSTVSNYMRILELSQPIQDFIVQNRLGMGHGRCLLGIPDLRRREELAKRCTEGEWSVRTLEEMVRKEKESPAGGVVTAKPVLAKASPHLRDLQQRFEHTLKTKVTIVEGRRKGSGRIIMEYYSLDDFDRIANALGIQTD